MVATDRAKLVQALDNLLDNAAKFSPPGAAIDVGVNVTSEEVVISVRDRGPGISPEHWSRVFERFYKVDRARPRESGGFGLGLAITKHLVQMLGGRIWTETAREGGQVFYIALPNQPLTNT
jgi:signal transduction histidine kinase